MATEIVATTTAPAPDVQRMPFWGTCTECSHTWTVAYLPMAVAKFVKVVRSARCPMCGCGKVRTSKQTAGVCFEKTEDKR